MNGTRLCRSGCVVALGWLLLAAPLPVGAAEPNHGGTDHPPSVSTQGEQATHGASGQPTTDHRGPHDASGNVGGGMNGGHMMGGGGGMGGSGMGGGGMGGSGMGGGHMMGGRH